MEYIYINPFEEKDCIKNNPFIKRECDCNKCKKERENNPFKIKRNYLFICRRVMVNSKNG